MRNKYGNKRVNGHASIREDKRATELKWMEKAGVIKDLMEQVPFELVPNQYKDGKCIERAGKYIADFVYTDVASGEIIVEDTKGFRTPDYIIKRKLMLKVHDVRIKEV